MEEDIREVYKTLQKSQDKYVYFLLATTITAIGFAITRTQNLKLDITQIFLALSILCWGISFICGCRNREHYNSFLCNNFQALNLKDDIKIKKDEIDILLNNMSYNNLMFERLSRAQMYFFAAGVILYLIWHIIQMYLNK
ncbi:hypothetical protein [Clostridium beijerinckii]|uniref:hypothetical protein n=1 Tax=Clostridium beijerinckii TaxID=1520 RepID=UPI001F1719C5|nr:hypothetical protein [Clostridium beijerinckii]